MNITSPIANGTPIQKTSIQNLLRVGGLERSTFDPRRYRIAKLTIRMKISAVKNAGDRELEE